MANCSVNQYIFYYSGFVIFSKVGMNMKHWHAVRYSTSREIRPMYRMRVITSSHRELTLGDVANFQKDGLYLFQSFYIGYGDKSILEDFKGTGLLEELKKIAP